MTLYSVYSKASRCIILHRYVIRFIWKCCLLRLVDGFRKYRWNRDVKDTTCRRVDTAVLWPAYKCTNWLVKWHHVTFMKIVISFLSTTRFGQCDRRDCCSDKCTFYCILLFVIPFFRHIVLYSKWDGFEFLSREIFFRDESGNFYRRKICPSIRGFGDNICRLEIFLANSIRAIWSNKPIRGEADWIYWSTVSMSREIWYPLWKQGLSAIFSSPREPLEYVGLEYVDKSRGNYFESNSRGNFSFSFLEILLLRVRINFLLFF
jgi:hypothetical protein